MIRLEVPESIRSSRVVKEEIIRGIREALEDRNGHGVVVARVGMGLAVAVEADGEMPREPQRFEQLADSAAQ